MRITTILGLLCSAAAAGCYESTPFDDEDTAPPDVALDDGGTAPDDAATVVDDGGAEEALFCGDEKEPRATGGAPIVNGTESFDPAVVRLSDGQVLAVGALLQRDWRTGSFENVCTATLVAPRTVLTAAHCLLGWTGPVRPADVRFAVGRDASDPVYTYQVAEVHVNPAYRPRGGDDQARADQGVVVLTEPAAEAVPEIRPIPVNRTDLPAEFLGTIVQNVGFGLTDPSGRIGNSLRWWTTEVVTEVREYDYTVYGGGVSSVCFGDSGGPGMWTFPDGVVRVAGTVSWGDESCVDYDHFARTDYNLDFLLPYLGEEDPCGGLDWEGACDGDDAVWCVDGVTYRRDCAGCGQTCGWAGPEWGYYCL